MSCQSNVKPAPCTTIVGKHFQLIPGIPKSGSDNGQLLTERCRRVRRCHLEADTNGR
jgi:hypothetical protein